MSDPTPYIRRSPLEHERDEGGSNHIELVKLRSTSPATGTVEMIRRCHAAAARIEGLQAEALDWRAQVGELYDKCKALEAEVARLGEALSFYAWGNRTELPSEGPWGTNSTDFGRRARADLAQEGEG